MQAPQVGLALRGVICKISSPLGSFCQELDPLFRSTEFIVTPMPTLAAGLQLHLPLEVVLPLEVSHNINRCLK